MRHVVRYLQIGAGPRRSPSACSRDSSEKKISVLQPVLKIVDFREGSSALRRAETTSEKEMVGVEVGIIVAMPDASLAMPAASSGVKLGVGLGDREAGVEVLDGSAETIEVSAGIEAGADVGAEAGAEVGAGALSGACGVVSRCCEVVIIACSGEGGAEVGVVSVGVCVEAGVGTMSGMNERSAGRTVVVKLAYGSGIGSASACITTMQTQRRVIVANMPVVRASARWWRNKCSRMSTRRHHGTNQLR